MKNVAAVFLSRAETYVRALRLPFSAASALPFVFGSLVAPGPFNGICFIFGLVAVIATHLGANLINDYADARSGADWRDRTFYGFFGGSKLIQEGVLSMQWYAWGAIVNFFIAAMCVTALAGMLKTASVFAYFSAVVFLGVAYSYAPFQLSYRRLGECVIFLLFGPVVVMGGYFIQTQRFPTLESFMLSVPFGFFTTAILFANEVADSRDDYAAGKYTWASSIQPARAYLVYYALSFSGFVALGMNIIRGYLPVSAFVAMVCVIPAIKAGMVLKCFYADKTKLIEASRLTIMTQAFVSILLIVSVVL